MIVHMSHCASHTSKVIKKQLTNTSPLLACVIIQDCEFCSFLSRGVVFPCVQFASAVGSLKLAAWENTPFACPAKDEIYFSQIAIT